MKREWHLARGVAGADARSDQPRARRRAHSSEVDRMTVVEVLGRVDELADGTGGTADAVRGDGNRSISEIPAHTGAQELLEARSCSRWGATP